MTARGAGGVELQRWWSRRWIDLLEEGAGATHARRVQRGQGLARRGAVEDFEVRAGRIRGAVAEERGGPARVEIRWQVPDDDTWDAAVAALSAELRFTAALLEGTLPEDVVGTLAAAGVPLFPTLDELEHGCTCDERGPLCRHAAAVHSVAATRFEHDPFLLLELRGRDRERLLRALRTERGVDASEPPVATDLSQGLFAARGDLDAIELHPAPVEDPGALLRHLGEPPGMGDAGPLVRLVERAAATAWRLAAGDGAAAADEELLLTELRAQRVGSVASLAAALGRDSQQVRAELDRLFEAGAVMRTGSGERARYRTGTSGTSQA